MFKNLILKLKFKNKQLLIGFENFYFSKIFQKDFLMASKFLCLHKFLERLLNGFSKKFM